MKAYQVTIPRHHEKDFIYWCFKCNFPLKETWISIINDENGKIRQRQVYEVCCQGNTNFMGLFENEFMYLFSDDVEKNKELIREMTPEEIFIDNNKAKENMKNAPKSIMDNFVPPEECFKKE